MVDIATYVFLKVDKIRNPLNIQRTPRVPPEKMRSSVDLGVKSPGRVAGWLDKIMF